jgi:toxin ParE1/3/4
MSRFRLSVAASEDLIAIYIQGHDQFGPRQADRYQDELTAAFQQLAAFPGLARLRSEHQPPVRILPHKAHVIVYEEEADGVLVLRVRHGHEDWRNDPLGGAGSEP